MKIAIFGGSFDPPHIGHEEIVNKVINQINIDKLIVVPTFLNPFKTKSDISPTTRYELVSNLFEDNIKVDISDFELLQQKATPSINTVLYLKQIYNPSIIYLIIGADNLKSLEKWYKFNELNSLVTFIVITRDKYEVKNDIIQFIKINMDIDISSTQIRQNKNIDYIPKKILQKVQQIWKKESKEL